MCMMVGVLIVVVVAVVACAHGRKEMLIYADDCVLVDSTLPSDHPPASPARTTMCTACG